MFIILFDDKQYFLYYIINLLQIIYFYLNFIKYLNHSFPEYGFAFS